MSEENSTRDHNQALRSYKRLEQSAFLLLLGAVSLVFAYLLKPFFAPIFWAFVVTILFYPMHLYLLNRWQKPTLAALSTLAICILVAVVPALFLLDALIHEGSVLYQRIESGEFNPSTYIDQIREGLPVVQSLLERLQIDLGSVHKQLSEAAVVVSRWSAENALSIGQNMVGFLVSLLLMLYMTFFLLRDGPSMILLIISALPLGDERERLLLGKVAEVTRATVKGNLVVAIVQGTLGGLMFWVLDIPGPVFWGVMMILLSLIPVVGASLIWAPVAIYLFAVGDWNKAVILTAFGAGVIGLIDNFLRPILVGRDTKLPDYLVLLSTLGGFALFGMTGFVIGPLIAVLFIAFWQIFIIDFNTPPAGEASESELTAGDKSLIEIDQKSE